jgi:hypothetical protein
VIYQVVKPIRVASNARVFSPGETLEADREKAKRYVDLGGASACRPSRNLRELSLAPSQVVEWKSPLFGMVSGLVEWVLEDGRVIVDHPVTGKWTSIPRESITQIVGETG